MGTGAQGRRMLNASLTASIHNPTDTIHEVHAYFQLASTPCQ